MVTSSLLLLVARSCHNFDFLYSFKPHLCNTLLKGAGRVYCYYDNDISTSYHHSCKSRWQICFNGLVFALRVSIRQKRPKTSLTFKFYSDVTGAFVRCWNILNIHCSVWAHKTGAGRDSFSRSGHKAWALFSLESNEERRWHSKKGSLAEKIQFSYQDIYLFRSSFTYWVP